MSKTRAAQMAGAWWAERLQQGDKARFAEVVAVRVLEVLATREVVHLECNHSAA